MEDVMKKIRSFSSISFRCMKRKANKVVDLLLNMGTGADWGEIFLKTRWQDLEGGENCQRLQSVIVEDTNNYSQIRSTGNNAQGCKRVMQDTEQRVRKQSERGDTWRYKYNRSAQHSG
jgi:hypothetical protein